MSNPVAAEKLPYWRTSRSSPDSWLAKAVTVIERYGGEVETQGYVRQRGRGGFLIAFTTDGDSFKVTWPVTASKCEDRGAEERQAATMLYHYCKAAVVAAEVLGPRSAFMPFLLLENGKTMAETHTLELSNALPKMLEAPQ